MAKIIQFISHKNYHLLVNNSFYFCLLIKILIENKVFELKVSFKTKKTEFVNLFIYGLMIIVVGNPLKKYQYWA